MKPLFKNVSHLDKRLVSKFGLSEDLMMEHAANALNLWVRKNLKKGKSIQILCGCGNNGADGIACARMLKGDYKVSILLPLGVKSKMAKIQFERAKKLNLHVSKKIKKASLYVDAIFGSGLDRPLSDEILQILIKINALKALKLSCDIPTGIMENGNILHVAFKADTTITMGALKSSLFSDFAKDYVGDLHVSDLGVSRKLYETTSSNFLLEKKDLNLPFRQKQNTNKGNFGHLVVISGEKKGASLLTSKAGFAFGAGLVSVLGSDLDLPEFLMQCNDLPKNASAIACGMGLGKINDSIKKLLTNSTLPLLLDADILNSTHLKQILHVKENIILTPHPKEFSQMCKNLDFGDFSVKQIQANKLELAQKFSLKFPQILVLKGANTIIAHKGKCFINPFGTSALAKGGSGDILSGLIASLMAQNYSLISSAINGVLAHSLSAKNFTKNDYSLFPNDIIKGLKCL